MIGFPNFVNTMQDLIHLKGEFPDETKAYLRDILDHKDQWILVGELKEGEEGVTDATHKVEETRNLETGDTVSRYQFEFKEDPNGALYRLGFAGSFQVHQFIAGIK